MSPIRPNVRPALSRAARFATFVALSAALLGASGCHWFHKKDIYAAEGDQRPLEFPPTFDQAAADRAAEPTGPVTRSSMAGDPAVRASSFSVAGDRATVFAKVGEALAGVQGATVANRAQLLGAYDIDYAGETFLVRITDLDGGRSQVAAVDPRGQPAAGAGATKLVAALKAMLGGQ